MLYPNEIQPMKFWPTYEMSKFVFMGYGCNLFDMIIAHFVAVFISIKKENP